MLRNIFMKWSKVIVIALIVMGAAFLALTLFSDPDPPGKKNITVETIPDPEARGENYSITVNDIPQTFSERRLAPAAALLPTRAGYPEATPAVVAEETRQSILQAAERWLQKWETFRPGEADMGKYTKRIRNLSWKDSLPRLVRREDASDPPSVGPEGSSRLASRWLDVPGFSQSAFVIDYAPGEAYVVAYGAVRYIGAINDPLSGSSRERTYGLLLQEKGGRWLVERAAAEGIR